MVSWARLLFGLWMLTRWWFQISVIFTPIWGRFPLWRIFFNWVETTNQMMASPTDGNICHPLKAMIQNKMGSRRRRWKVCWKLRCVLCRTALPMCAWLVALTRVWVQRSTMAWETLKTDTRSGEELHFFPVLCLYIHFHVYVYVYMNIYMFFIYTYVYLFIFIRIYTYVSL